jgi:transposase-like protein
MKKRRSFSPDFKARVVLEVLARQRSRAKACRHYQIKDSLLARWIQQFLEGRPPRSLTTSSTAPDRICRMLALPRSNYYASLERQRHRSDADESLASALEQVAATWPTYGYRRVTEELRRSGYAVGHKRVRRMMAERGLLGRKPTRKTYTTDSRHGYRRWPNLVMDLDMVCPDQVWVSDITYVRLGYEFVYLAVIMDVYTRSIRGWSLSRNLDGQLTLSALEEALTRGCCQIHHSDQLNLTNMQLPPTSAGVGRCEDLDGGRRAGLAERLCRALDAHDQGGRSRPFGLRGSLRCA